MKDYFIQMGFYDAKSTKRPCKSARCCRGRKAGILVPSQTERM
nr:MAG TPA: hypothetical protein [Caudoviricetes sp.]